MFIFECKCKSYIDISCDSLFCNVSSLSRPRASEFWERIGGGEASTGTWQFERVHLIKASWSSGLPAALVKPMFTRLPISCPKTRRCCLSSSIFMCFFLYKTSIFLGTTGDQRNTAKPLEVPLKVFECVSTRLVIMFELLQWWRWWGWVDLKLIGAIKSEQPVLAIKLPEWGGSENHQWLPCQICCFPNVKDLGHVWWQVAVGWRFG